MADRAYKRISEKVAIPKAVRFVQRVVERGRGIERQRKTPLFFVLSRFRVKTINKVRSTVNRIRDAQRGV